MLHGPQDKGAAIDQTNVDALLQGSGQDAIDALFD